MKKTITANISGSVFHIEEDAYNQLNAYLSNIRQKFKGSPDADEIIADIEGRIAELFLERMKSERQVVTTDDVDSIVQTMGTPEDYFNPEEEEARAAYAARSTSGRRKLYRDPDDRWLGGVIGGIAAYFDANVTLLRVLFIISIFLGLPIIIYIVAWIVIPKAITNAEKLEMRGEPVTVENLKKMFDDGVDAVEKGAKNLADKASSLGKEVRSGKPGNGVDRFFSFLGDSLGYLFKALAKIFGFLFILVGSLLVVAVLVVLLGKFSFVWEGVDFMEGGNLKDMAGMVFNNMGQAIWMGIAVALALLAPAIWFISAGTAIMTNKRTNRWVNIILIPFWIIAVGIVFFIGAQIGFDHHESVKVRTDVEIVQPRGEFMMVSCLSDPHFGDNSEPDSPNQIKIDGDKAYFGWVGLDVESSPDSLYHLIAIQRANGRSSKKARLRAKNILYMVEQTDSLIRIAPYFSIPTKDRFRAQEQEFVLQVPVGKAVYFDESAVEIIDDIYNVQHVHDQDMTGYTWTMTPNGLSNAVAPEDVPNDLPSMEPDEEEHDPEGDPVARIEEPKASLSLAMPPLIGQIR